MPRETEEELTPKEPVAGEQESADEPGPSRWGAAIKATWHMATLGPRFALHVARYAADEAEDRAMRHVRDRLNEMSSDDVPMERGGPGDSLIGRASDLRHPARTHVQRLLKSARKQTLGQAEQHLHLRIARQLVPDEARLLAWLFEGNSSPLMHVGSGPLVGPATRRWLENLSPVAHEANLTVRDRTPEYIGHLRGLGLLESGNEDPRFKATYQKMEVDTEVREACKEMEKENHRPRFYRRTLQLTDLGRRFCEACMSPDMD